MNKDDKVITIGLDDTTKAASHRHYDMKIDHITIVGKSGDRTSLTTGEDIAKVYDF